MLVLVGETNRVKLFGVNLEDSLLPDMRSYFDLFDFLDDLAEDFEAYLAVAMDLIGAYGDSLFSNELFSFLLWDLRLALMSCSTDFCDLYGLIGLS